MIGRRALLGLGTAAAAGAVLGGCTGSDDGTNPVGRKLTTPENPTAAEAETGDSGGTPRRLPDVELAWLTGGSGTVALSSLEGPMVLNIWAQWCPPCREELPFFQRLYARSEERVRVVGLDFEDRAENALDFIDRLGLRYPHLQDPKGTVKAHFRLGVGLPVTVFVGPDAAIERLVYKAYRSEHELLTDVRRHLGVRL
ncbi:MAG TPA: TlpA disulfide reductase family protein [Actinopolymorphaceae bacterium]